MSNCYRVITLFVLAILLGPFSLPGWAQPPPPKASKADKSPVKKAERKTAAEKREAAPAAKESATERPSAPESPAVAAVLQTKPTAPLECVRAARVLVDLGRPDLAKDLVKKVLEAKLDEPQLAELGEQAGSTVFLDLAGQPALLPEAQQLADAMVAALRAKREDAGRIAGLIRQLQDPSTEKRAEAVTGLRAARGAAVGPLLSVLADPARAAEQASARAVLAEMGRLSREPLVGILRRANPKLMVQAILTLAEMKNPSVELCLLRPCLASDGDAEVRAAAATVLRQLTGRVPTRPEAVGLLSDAARLYFEQRHPLEGVADGKVELWQWDEGGQQCVATNFAADDAARTLAARWARDAYSLAPDDREFRLLHLATMLEAAAYQKGLDRPLEDDEPAAAGAKHFGVKTINEALNYGMTLGHPAAATAAARLLGQIGEAEEVLYAGAAPAPLVRALRQSDRRLRMAALEAIVRLQPTRPFAGASYVPAALAFFAASSGVRHALVAGPNIEETRELAGLLATAGFQTDSALNGKDLLNLAARSPDYELALIDMAIDRPVINMLVQQLRHDERTGSLRVGLIAHAGYLERAERLARQDPLTLAFSRPHDEESLRWQVAQLATLAPREFVSFDVRQQQAARSLALWAELSRTSGKLYDLRRLQDSVLAALYTPTLAQKAVAALADINSAESQRALVEVASRFTQPLELRIAAARAFRENTEKHGILLTSGEIRTQYRRYNESENLDAPTQHVLGLILDCLEAPTAARFRVQSSGFQAPDPLGASTVGPRSLNPEH